MNCLTADGRYLGLMVGEERWSTVSQQKLEFAFQIQFVVNSRQQ